MKILLVTNHLELVGGTEAIVSAIIPGLLATGHEVAVLNEAPYDEAKSFLNFSNRKSIPIFDFSNLGLKKSIIRAKKWKPDVVYNNGILDFELENEILSNWPCFFYCHSTRGTCLSGTKFWKFPEPRMCEKSFGFACLLRYGLNRCGGKNPLKAFELFRKSKARMDVVKKYKHVFVASEWMRNVFLQNGLLPNKVSLVPLFPYGVERSSDAPLPRDPNNLLIFTGRMVENKGWRHAVDATKTASKLLNRGLKLILAGNGPEEDLVRNYAEKAGIDFDISGFLDPESLNRLRCRADLQIVPSLLGEGFGLVGIEAGCLGLPSVGYPVGGVADWLIHGATGGSYPRQPNQSYRAWAGYFQDFIRYRLLAFTTSWCLETFKPFYLGQAFGIIE